jgi:ABC-type transport system substrate-binding protein/class 3 adenylate cyclase
MDERRPVTILFTDIVGSTALAEKLDPEEWKEVVNGAHQRVSAAVTRYGGTVAQLLGDGVLAFFGAPVAHEDDPSRAVQAGLEIQRTIADYARTLDGYVDTFQMRVGINTGMVVVGAVGSLEHSEYLAVGDAVNLAARMQSAAQPGRVLLAEATARLVRNSFQLQDIGEISVKGKGEPVRVFEVADTREGLTVGRGIEGISSPVIGRERELKQLRDALTELRAGHGQVVFILGEAGIGKSRLIEEVRRASGDNTPRFLEGRAVSYGQNLSFWTIKQLIRNDLGITDGAPETKIKVTLRRRVKELFGDKSDDVLPYLAHLSGVDLEGELAERVKLLDGETLKRQVLISTADYFAKLAQQQPTVLVFEDLHWADPSSLEALERLLRVTERAPLGIIALMRAETDRPAWRVREIAAREYRRRFREIELEPLSPVEAGQLVANLLAIAELPDATVRLILDRAEGNPFYLEELIRSLIEQGAIVRSENGTWRAQALIAKVQIPDTLQALLLARIDRLHDDVKRTLQLAAVIGRSFLYRVLEAISAAENAARELDWQLAQLEHADLVRETTRLPELEYMFKHWLTQEAAYDSLLIERRREFHRKVGAALEELFAERKDEFLGLLAYHLDRAGEKAKAIDYLIRAGDKARLEDAHEEAIQFYRRAIELLHELGDSEREAKTWLKLGMVEHTNFNFAAAQRANETAFEMQQEQRRRRDIGANIQVGGSNRFRWSGIWEEQYITLDPGLVKDINAGSIVYALFAGIAQLDAEFNLIPHAARSWEVLNDGTRYVVHLRDDVRWTDGTAVTATDYEWAWKRNLTPATKAEFASALDDIVGARAFRQGMTANADSVGIRAFDALTLEIRLERPAAYFPYLFASWVTLPLPKRVIEQAGSEWWKPEHIVSNGAFRLVRFEQDGGALERNADYFGEFSGNLDGYEWRMIPDESERTRAYLNGELDRTEYTSASGPLLVALGASKEEFQIASEISTAYLAIFPQRPPLDDVRVRRALIQSIDRDRIPVEARLNRTIARGGIIPPGIPGHSPEIGLPFDVETARRLLAEAGFPEGRNFPRLTLTCTYSAQEPKAQEIVRQWREHLGITIQIGQPNIDWESSEQIPEIACSPWTPDYPDPDGVLRTLPLYDVLLRAGWGNARFGELVAEAARTADRARRLEMYREAERIWVAEEAVVCALFYNWAGFILTKPWVKGATLTPLGHLSIQNITVEPH